MVKIKKIKKLLNKKQYILIILSLIFIVCTILVFTFDDKYIHYFKLSKIFSHNKKNEVNASLEIKNNNQNDDIYGKSLSKSDIIETDNYFNDVIFVGDSITNGLQLYKSVKNALILSKTSLNIENLANETININGKSILDMIKESNRKKIYIMLGSNGIGWLDDNYMINLYSQWLNKLRYEVPDCTIFVQSVLPITKELSDLNLNKQNAITNEKIFEYNKKLLDMCQREKYYYLDISNAFKDENGYLIDEASPVDGMHISSKYYNKWVDYIKTHVPPSQ